MEEGQDGVKVGAGKGEGCLKYVSVCIRLKKCVGICVDV